MSEEPWKDPMKVAELVAKGIEPKAAREALFKAVRPEPTRMEWAEGMVQNIWRAVKEEILPQDSVAETVELQIKCFRALGEGFYAATDHGKWTAELNAAREWPHALP